MFRRLSHYSTLHLADARARAGFREMPEIKPGDFIWPDLESPERAAIWAADPMIGREEALEIALVRRTGRTAYYQSVLDATDDPEIMVMAAEFVKEENEHVAELKKWIAAHRSGELLPVDH